MTLNETEDKVNNKGEEGINILEKRKKINSNLILLVAFFSGVLLIISTYAWLSVSLDVKVKFFDMSVSSDSGLFISLDGINYSDSVEISMDSIIKDLKETYPDHTNQWSTAGLWPVSSNGIRNGNDPNFDMYKGELSKRRTETGSRLLNTFLMNEDKASAANIYISFDIFLKNVSGSPKSDNLFLDEGTMLTFDEEATEETKESMSGIMNSIRFGFVKIGSLPTKTEPRAIQHMTCNNNCQTVIYEPRATSHSLASVFEAYANYGITLTDGVKSPTYAIINEGENLKPTNGHPGSGIPLDRSHFALQNTITNFNRPIFTLPSAVTKMRVNIWIEGQDMDSLETHSDGSGVYLAIDFFKDLAGYE